MSRKVILLYGSGPNVGAAILKKFAANGWKTAAVVRTMKDEYKNSADLVLQADFADAQEIQKLYSEVESKLGTPNCVCYNGESLPITEFSRANRYAKLMLLNRVALTLQTFLLLHPKTSPGILPLIQLHVTQLLLLLSLVLQSCHQDPRCSSSPAMASLHRLCPNSLAWEAERQLRPI